MLRKTAALLLLLAASACAPPTKSTPTASPTPTPRPTLPPVTAGGVVSLGRTVISSTGSRITVTSWRYGSPPGRAIGNGPGQTYETANVVFCAGQQVEENTSDLTPLFALQLPSGDRVAVDSQSGPGDFRTKGAIHAGQCVGGPLVFQVQGGIKPKYVRFDSTKQTKWVVP